MLVFVHVLIDLAIVLVQPELEFILFMKFVLLESYCSIATKAL